MYPKPYIFRYETMKRKMNQNFQRIKNEPSEVEVVQVEESHKDDDEVMEELEDSEDKGINTFSVLS